MKYYTISQETLNSLGDKIRQLSGTNELLTTTTAIAELQTQSDNIEEVKQALRDKGVNVGEGTNLGDLSDLVGEVESGIDTSDATATAGDILSGETAYVNGEKLTGTIATKTNSDLTTSGTVVTVPAGYYASQVTKSVSDANLKAENIKSGVSIFGVTGSLSTNTMSVHTGISSPTNDIGVDGDIYLVVS